MIISVTIAELHLCSDEADLTQDMVCKSCAFLSLSDACCTIHAMPHQHTLDCRLCRNILADKPRVTKFPVDFDSPEAANPEDASPEDTQNAAESAQLDGTNQSPMSADQQDDEDPLAEPEVQGQQISAEMES